MIQNTITKYYDGNITLQDALIDMELKRHQLEQELKFLKDFKDQNSSEIKSLSEEYKDGYNGYMFEVRNGRTMFSYKNIDEWKTYYKNLKDCEDRYKQVYLSVQKGLMVASEDGEELQLPDVSYGKPSVIIKELTTV